MRVTVLEGLAQHLRIEKIGARLGNDESTNANHPDDKDIPMIYSDAEAAALYGVLNAWAPSDDFYLGLVMDATAVLDVGCGTGTLLHRARETGHAGRLCGLDPDVAMLDVARQRTDIEWQVGTAASLSSIEEFDLAVMSGHAFQCFFEDSDLRASLAAIRNALVAGGRFAFETRNPLVREWERWNPNNPIDAIDRAGRAIRMIYNVESVAGEVVTFTESTCEPDGTPLRVDRASLRFLSAERLAEFLSEAGFQIEAQFGNWDRAPFTPASREIITIART